MKNIEMILSELGIEVTDEQREAIKKSVVENYKTITDYEKKTNALKDLQAQYDETKNALESFSDVDVDDLKRQIEEAQKKVKETEENAKKQLAERDYNDAINSHVSALKFSSNGAKKSFINDLKEKGLKIENGKLLGFDDYVKEYKENDSGAFINENEEKKAKFTGGTSIDKAGEQSFNATIEASKLREAFGLPAEK